MKFSESTTQCPTCGRELDYHITMDELVAPVPGDVAICAYCETPMVFASIEPSITVRKLMEEENEIWKNHPQREAAEEMTKLVMTEELG